MKKKIFQFTAFFLTVFVLFIGISYVLADRETTFSAVYSEPDNSVDVLIVGSSHVNSGYIPSLLWENNNLSAVNAFSWSQPTWVSYHYILEALKTQSPEYIVLEMYGMVYGHSYIMPEEIDKTNYNNSFNLDMSLNRLKLIKTSEFCGLDLRNAQDFFNISRYHTRWKSFDLSYLSYNPHRQHDYLKGYGYLTASAGLEKPDVPVAQDILTPYEYCVEYIDKITDLCKKEGIELIFTLTPYIYGTEETGVLNWIEQYSAEKNIPFFNYLYGDDYERIGFDYSADLADNGHCNYYGAVKVTEDLCRYLDSTGASAPAKEQHTHYAMLQEDYSKYCRVPAVSLLMSNTEPDTLIAACAADSNVSLFINACGAPESTAEMVNSWLVPYSTTLSAEGYAVLSTAEHHWNGNSVDFDLFETPGRVEFAADSCEILLNGTAAPGGKDSAVKIVIYDNELSRPLMSVWTDGYDLTVKEFTTDILDNYR